MGVKLTAERARSLLIVPRKRQELVDELNMLSPTGVVELFAQLTEQERLLVFRLLPMVSVALWALSWKRGTRWNRKK